MTQSIVGQVYSEDFNYGYPYTDPHRGFRTLPPQFTYNHEAITARGVLRTSTRFQALGRNAFTMCYLSKALEPNNIDLGAHSGAHNAAPYYMLFPVMQWNEVVVLDFVINVLDDHSYMTYDRSFDGVAGDRFIVIVNGQERAVFHRTAGHGWTTDIVFLTKGRARVQWVVQTKKYVPPVTRSGTAVSTTAPNVPRYFRMCRLTVQNVSTFPGGTVGNYGTPVYAELGSQGSTSVSTATFVGRKGKRGQAAMKVYGTALYKGKNAVDNMVGGATTTFSPRQSVRATSAMFGLTAFGPTGNISLTHSGYDAQLELTSTGALTVEVPFNTPQAVTSLIRNLQSVTLTMSTPVFVNGKPMTPKYQDTQNFTATSSGGYVYTDPVSPSSINHVLPVTPKYRWITTDIGGADDSNVTNWPEHVTPASNPAWVSNAVYAPTVHPHEHFVDRDATYVTYSRTLHFYDHYGEHMWMTMPANAFPTTVTNVTPYQPFTWMFVAMLHPILNMDYTDRSHTLLDSYLNSATPADYSQQLQDGEYITVNDGTGAFRSLIKFQPGKAIMSSNTSTILTRPWILNYKPCVYFGVFNGTSSSLTAYGDNYFQRIVGPTGSGSNYQQGFMMGRTNGHMNHLNLTTMTMFETAFYNRVVTATEQATLARYLAGVYQFQKYR